MYINLKEQENLTGDNFSQHTFSSVFELNKTNTSLKCSFLAPKLTESNVNWHAWNTIRNFCFAKVLLFCFDSVTF